MVSAIEIEFSSLLTFHRMGELEPWIDENFVRNLWFQMGEQVSVKMIRDKFSGSVFMLHLTVVTLNSS